MKFFISLLLMIFLSFAACLYMGWWSISIVCFIVAALIPQRPGTAFLTGFLALFILWGGLSFWISNNNNHLLAHKVSVIIIKNDNPFLLILITAIVGALVGGFAAITGACLRATPKAK